MISCLGNFFFLPFHFQTLEYCQEDLDTPVLFIDSTHTSLLSSQLPECPQQTKAYKSICHLSSLFSSLLPDTQSQSWMKNPSNPYPSLPAKRKWHSLFISMFSPCQSIFSWFQLRAAHWLAGVQHPWVEEHVYYGKHRFYWQIFETIASNWLALFRR